MRLTEKNEFGYILRIKSIDNSLGNEIDVIGKTANKLGQLEDIEEELGIDLITLFKISPLQLKALAELTKEELE